MIWPSLCYANKTRDFLSDLFGLVSRPLDVCDFGAKPGCDHDYHDERCDLIMTYVAPSWPHRRKITDMLFFVCTGIRCFSAHLSLHCSFRGQFNTSSVLVQGTGGAQCLPQAGRSGSVLTAGVGIKGTHQQTQTWRCPFRQKREVGLAAVRSQLAPKFPHVPYSGVPGSGSVRIQALT